jgi:hypothetical protein
MVHDDHAPRIVRSLALRFVGGGRFQEIGIEHGRCPGHVSKVGEVSVTLGTSAALLR